MSDSEIDRFVWVFQRHPNRVTRGRVSPWEIAAMTSCQYLIFPDFYRLSD